MSKTQRLIGIALMLVGMMVATAGVAFATHVNDGGVDQAWTNDMNQESYWENLWDADCTKYETHSGVIPAGYDAVVVKDGNYVRVYNPAPSPFTALGAVNPANDKHFDPPHSWVMKCKSTDTTTTTVTPSSTTSTTVQQTTSTTESSTSTTASPTSTDPSPTSTSSAPPTTSTNPTPPTTTSTPTTTPTPPDELPFTGVPLMLPLAVIGTGLIGAGIRLVRHN